MKPRRIRLGSWGVGRGLCEGEFASLNERTLRRLVTLMSRISESSFRRGLQHGQHFERKGIRLWITPEKLRFDISLDKSPMPCSRFPKFSATDRLQFEHGGTLQALGFVLPKGWGEP